MSGSKRSGTTQLRVGRLVKAHGLKAGIHNGSAAYAKKMIAAGFDLVTVGSDARFMAAEAANVAAAMQDRPAPGGSGGTY